MDKNVLFPLILSLIAGLSTVIGASLVFVANTKNKKFLTFALGFSAGVMITVSFTDLFPAAESAITKYYGKVNGILLSILFLIVGALMAFLIDIFIPEDEKNRFPKDDKNSGLFRIGLVSTIAIVIHNFPEGIATFVSGYQDASLGLFVALAITLHNIPEGIAIAMPIYYGTKNRLKAIKYALFSGMAEPFGAIIAFLFLRPFLNELILGIVFAIVSGIMLFIALDELLPSSRESGYTKLSICSVFLGIIIMPITHLIL